MGKTYRRADLLSQCSRTSSEQVRLVDELFSSHHEDILLTSPLPGKWSAKQCIEHLIATLDLYLPRLDKKLSSATDFSGEDMKHGFIGYKFLTDILPSESGEIKRRMKTFKSLQPKSSGNTVEEVVKDFEHKMNLLRNLINIGSTKNIQSLKIVSAAGVFLKLRIGDVIPFLLNHNHRHILQAQKAIQINVKRKSLDEHI